MKKEPFIIIALMLLSLALVIPSMRAESTLNRNPENDLKSRDEQEGKKKLKDNCAKGLCISFLGSTSLENNYAIGDKSFEKYRIEPKNSLVNYRDFLTSSHHTIAALQSALIERPKKKPKAFSWSDVSKASFFKEAKLDAVALANRNISKVSPPALRETITNLQKQNIAWFGIDGEDTKQAFHLFEKKLKGGVFKLAVLSALDHKGRASRGGDLVKFDIASLSTRIKILKSTEPDTYLVVFVNWGKKGKRPLQKQQESARALLDAGADLLVGYGSHALQGIERYKKKWIVYDIGDFVFHGPDKFRDSNDKLEYSAVLRLFVSDSKPMRKPVLKLYPIHTNNSKNKYRGDFVNAKQMGTAFWGLMLKNKIKWSRGLKQKLMVSRDRYGRFIHLRRGSN